MTTDVEDRSTWPRNGQQIRRPDLLRLIEENGEAWDLDLRGAIFLSGESSYEIPATGIDLSPEALAPLAAAYRRAPGHGGKPPWLSYGGGIDLSGARLSGAYLSGAQLQGAFLQRTVLDRGLLWGAQLQGSWLRGAHLRAADLGTANLREATLDAADLRETRLWHTQLQGVDMYDVGSLDGARWNGALLDHTRITRESLGNAIGEETEAQKGWNPQGYREAKEAYLLLKNNFNQIGRYEEASWAYVKEQQMEKAMYFPTTQGKRWLNECLANLSKGTPGMLLTPLVFSWVHARIFLGLAPPAAGIFQSQVSRWRWLRNWAYELATGYGERPWNPVIGGLLIILGFAGGFCATRAIANLWDALIYSLATFATFNLADTGPTGRGADVASSVEALLGIAVLALVVFTLGNKMSRG